MERFTISLDDDLARDFDAFIAARGYGNRSEAVRDLIRARLEADAGASDEGHCVASLSFVYNHHERELSERLAGHQHAHHDGILGQRGQVDIDFDAFDAQGMRGLEALRVADDEAADDADGLAHEAPC